MDGKLRSVNTRFWEDPWIEGLSHNDKLLFIYLLTNSKTNMLGVYEISLNKISFETGLPIEMVSNGLKGFERVRKGYYIHEHVVLPNFLKNQRMNKNMVISAKNVFDGLSEVLKALMFDPKKEWFETLTKGFEMVRKVEVEDEIEEEEENKGLIPPSQWKEFLHNQEDLLMQLSRLGVDAIKAIDDFITERQLSGAKNPHDLKQHCYNFIKQQEVFKKQSPKNEPILSPIQRQKLRNGFGRDR